MFILNLKKLNICLSKKRVAGQITLGTTSQMQGILLCQTLIEVKAGASVLGRLYAQPAITLEANAIAQP